MQGSEVRGTCIVHHIRTRFSLTGKQTGTKAPCASHFNFYNTSIPWSADCLGRTDWRIVLDTQLGTWSCRDTGLSWMGYRHGDRHGVIYRYRVTDTCCSGCIGTGAMRASTNVHLTDRPRQKACYSSNSLPQLLRPISPYGPLSSHIYPIFLVFAGVKATQEDTMAFPPHCCPILGLRWGEWRWGDHPA